jgi:hypothetical protein
MNKLLLKEYLSLVVEKIRSKNVKKNKFGNKFDLKKLQSLESINIVEHYADTFLEKLGRGSSRAAYLLTSKTVLKVAINEKGLAQNEAEVDVFTNPKSRLIVAKIHKADDQYKWVISDLVNPVNTANQFNGGSNVDIEWPEFLDILQRGLRGKQKINNESKFFNSVLDTAKENDLLYGDLSQLDHWGKSPDGRIVLLDYGFTGEVWGKHYSSSSKKPKKATADTPTRSSDSENTSDGRSNYTTNNSSDSNVSTPSMTATRKSNDREKATRK